MSLFLTYDPENYEYILRPLGYAALVILFLALLACILAIGRRHKGERRMNTKQLVFCAMAMALAFVTSYIRLVSLPYGGSITLFSMLFIVLTGYFYGTRCGIITGVAYGVLQMITEPYIFAPLQVLLDYPLAFGCLGLSGFFCRRKHGLPIGYAVGVAGRYVCHVLSGYVFFAVYAPEGMNPLIYTLAYNLTYILPEMILTLIVICIPAVSKAIDTVKRQAL